MSLFSVIICTRNRRIALAGCLSSIFTAAARAASVGRVELIVVDNGSSDGTSAAVALMAQSASIPVILMREERAGLSYARNTGMAAASGTYMVFTDDDCQLSPDYFLELARHYASDDLLTIRGGRVDLGDPADAPVTIRTQPDPDWYHPCRPPGGFIQGCNMVIPREAANRIGGFDTRMGAGSPLHAAEDADYIVRAYTLGIAVAYVPDMQVLHFHGRRGTAAVKKILRNYNIGNGALYAKHLFTAPWLVRHFLWTARSALQEFGGGRMYDTTYGISYWSVIAQNLRGMIGFIFAVEPPAHSPQPRPVFETAQTSEYR